MMPVLPPGSRQEEERIRARLREGGRSLVALSGGVDSAVVAALAHEALGTEAVAVTLAGAAVASREVARAEAVARAIGIAHVVLPVDPLSVEEYRTNPSDRCYFCRRVETDRLRAFGQPRGITQYLDGLHSDDLSDDRPGLRAMDEAGFRHPLLEAGWTKADVRAAARARNLPNAEALSDACLASRIAHGDRITAELLARVESAETLLLDRGFRRVRVRVEGRGARIEVDPDEVIRLRGEPLASELTARVRALGFEPVTIDPIGYHGRRLAPVAPA